MSQKRQKQHVRNSLAKLLNLGRAATNTEIDTNSVEILRLEAIGLVRRVGTVQTGRRGRPAVQWRLTDKARKRVRRALAAA